MAIQVAKNASTPDGDIEAIRRDYIRATSLLARYADIAVVNVSCPNAPGYRELQQIEPLTKILTGVVGAAASADRKSRPAIMVKVSPDEDTGKYMRCSMGVRRGWSHRWEFNQTENGRAP
jgi:dihydroorotate dehydrogenase